MRMLSLGCPAQHCHAYSYRNGHHKNYGVNAAVLSVAARNNNKIDLSKRLSALSMSSKSSSSIEVVDGLDCLPNPKTPWLKLCPEIDENSGAILDSFYSIVENKVVRLNRRDCLGVPDEAKCFASAGEWLAFLDADQYCPIYLANPFYSNKDMGVVELPPLALIPSCISTNVDPRTGRVISLNMLNTDRPPADDELNIDPYCAWDSCDMSNFISHVAISHVDPRHHDCVATAITGEWNLLAYAHGWDDRETCLGWIGLQEETLRVNYNQVVFSHTYKLFYTINSSGIEVFDLFCERGRRSKRVLFFDMDDIKEKLENEFELEESTKLKDLREACFCCDDRQTEYLFCYHIVMLDDPGESSNLLLIVRYLQKTCDSKGEPPFKTLHFDVFKVVFEGRRLERLTSLGDHCVFVGADLSFSVRAAKHPRLQPNSIYFIDSNCALCYSVFFNNDRGIFNMDNNEIEPITCPYSTLFPLQQDVTEGASIISKCCDHVFWISPSNIKC